MRKSIHIQNKEDKCEENVSDDSDDGLKDVHNYKVGRKGVHGDVLCGAKLENLAEKVHPGFCCECFEKDIPAFQMFLDYAGLRKEK